MRRTGIIIFVVLIVLLCAPVLISYVDYAGSKAKYAVSGTSFVDRLSAIVSEERPFEMSEAASFEWDTMHIIGPYTDWERMEEAVGTTWYTSYPDYLLRKTPIGQYPLDDESMQKLVFVKDGRVMLDAIVSRGIADFTTVDKYRMSRAEASFDVEADDGRLVIRRLAA